MRTSSRQKSPNLRRQKSPSLNLATDFKKNVKHWKGLRWWEVEHSPREGPCKLSQSPRALWEGSLKIFFKQTYCLRPQVCLQKIFCPQVCLWKIFWELSHNAFSQRPRALWELTWSPPWVTVLPPTTFGFSTVYTSHPLPVSISWTGQEDALDHAYSCHTS